MPRGPNGEETATKRFVLLFTPTQHAEYFALARHLGRPLSEVIRAQLEKERARLARRGVKLQKR